MFSTASPPRSPATRSSRLGRSRRGVLALVGLLSLALAVGGVSFAAGGLTQQKRDDAKTLDSGVTTSRLRYVTYNIRSKLAPEIAIQDIIGLAHDGADIIALQEMGAAKRRQPLRAAVSDCSLCPYDTYMPGPAMMGAVPILYRWEKYRLVAAGSRLITPKTNVGKAGAGPAKISAKYANWVRLRDRVTGRLFVVINSHAVASIQNAKCRPNKKNKKRLNLYRKHMRTLQEMVSEFRAQGNVVITSGDFNVNYRCDSRVRAHAFPYHRLTSIGMLATYAVRGMPNRGTHVRGPGKDTRVIDQIWFTPTDGVAVTRQHVLAKYSSDHRPVMVDFTFG